MIRIATPLILAALWAGAATASSTLDGVYTSSQADRGAEAYAGNCALCHGADLTGTYEIPSLRGRFVARWSGAALDQLLDYVHSAMPLHQPGSLSPETDLDIIAFLLRSNGIPSGANELKPAPEALKRIRFQGPAFPAK